MKILLVGTGALATFFAARLSKAGHAITMLGTWKAGLDALATGGARLVDSAGIEHAFPVLATSRPAECQGATHALVLVKAWQTERAALQLSQALTADGLAVTLQNGLGNRETLAAHLGARRAALGVTTTGATLLGPGLVRAGGDGTVSIEYHPSLPELESALRSAAFDVRIVDDADSLIWGKLVVNAAINPLSALLRVPNGELLSRPSARELMTALANEAARVAFAEGVTLPFADPVQAAEDVARRTAANHSSMFQDVRRAAPTEIEAICGAIVRLGGRHGIPTPVNELCWKLVIALADLQPAATQTTSLHQPALAR
jgi:2-dehydropantoate 2-reductase